MSQRTAQLVNFYQQWRIEDQVRFYAGRRTVFDRAATQALSLSAILLGFTAAAAGAGRCPYRPGLGMVAVATILPAASTALTSYSSLYAFEQQSKIYSDAVRAVHAAARPVAKASPAAPGSAEEDAAELVKRVEAVFRQEQAQWGQLTSQLEIHDDTKA